jgi:hypothetical protein
MGSLALRPGDSLTIPWMALSVGFIRFVSSTDATQATRLLTLALVGLTPTEHTSLYWTHWFVKIRSASKELTFRRNTLDIHLHVQAVAFNLAPSCFLCAL